MNKDFERRDRRRGGFVQISSVVLYIASMIPHRLSCIPKGHNGLRAGLLEDHVESFEK